jgi:hypothetical protein
MIKINSKLDFMALEGLHSSDSVFALGTMKATENLDRIGLSQDLPDANSILASSPALNTVALTLVPTCAVTLLKNTSCFRIVCMCIYFGCASNGVNSCGRN